MAGRSGDGVELNVFVLRRATRSKRKSPSNRVNWNSATRRVARLARGAKRGWRGREYGRGVGWGRGQETEENAVEGGGYGGGEQQQQRHGTRGRNIYCHLLYHLPTDSLPELVNTS